MDKRTHIVVVAGPTASSKSALAAALAQRHGGVVINADSMQVYRDLRIVTARPTVAEEAAVPHRLYGVLGSVDSCSAGIWRRMAVAEIERACAAGQLPVVVGGTGLYLRALLEGIAEIPGVPATIRAEVRARADLVGPAAFHAELAARDPVMAGRLDPSDRQRTIRAAEVLAATGRSLAEWQAVPAEPFAGTAAVVLMDPPAAFLAKRIDRRFEAMMEQGALEEVRAFLATDPPPEAPLRRAVGVPDLAAHLAGQITLEVAVESGKAASRQYAKRQRTWFRHQLLSNLVINEPIDKQDSDSLSQIIFPFVDDFLLTGRR